MFKSFVRCYRCYRWYWCLTKTQFRDHMIQSSHSEETSVNEIKIKNNEWHCKQCTFINKSQTTNQCEMCGINRINNVKWHCKACTFENTVNNVSCLICGTQNEKVYYIYLFFYLICFFFILLNKKVNSDQVQYSYKIEDVKYMTYI